MGMRIGDLSARSGCPVVTIRYYEKEGLLDTPERTSANYRLYSQTALERLKFILHCRRHGIKLEDIRKLLVLRDNPQRECGFVHELVEKQLIHVEEQIKSLQALKQELIELNCAKACGQKGHCSILQRLDEIDECQFCQTLRDKKKGRG